MSNASKSSLPQPVPEVKAGRRKTARAPVALLDPRGNPILSDSGEALTDADELPAASGPLFVLCGTVRHRVTTYDPKDGPASPATAHHADYVFEEGDEVDPALFEEAELLRLRKAGVLGPQPEVRESIFPRTNRPAPRAGVTGSGSAPWNLDPSLLQNKKLDELKVMIHERDPKLDLKQFEETDEAIAYLSKDYAGPPAQTARKS